MRRLHLKRLLVMLMCAGLSGLSASPAPAFAKPAKHAAARHGRLHRLAAKAAGRHHPKVIRAKVIRASLARLAVRALPEPERGAHAYASCSDAPEAFVRAAETNAHSLEDLDWAPFGQPETGWQVYDLLVGREIGAVCGSGTPVFAEKLAAFQARYQLPADGVFTAATFEVVKGLLQERRPFVMARLAKICPDAPTEAELVPVPKEAETFGREGRLIRADAFAAYQRMVAAARAELPSLKDDPKALTIFSAYRSPEFGRGALRRAGQLRRSAPRGLLIASDRHGDRHQRRLDSRRRGRLHLAREPAAADAYGALPLAGDERGALRLRQLPVRALALGMDRLAR